MTDEQKQFLTVMADNAELLGMPDLAHELRWRRDWGQPETWTSVNSAPPPECAEGGQSDPVLVWRETPPGARPVMRAPEVETYVHTRESWANFVPYTHWRPLPKPPGVTNG